jgi:hypothetical protein
MAAMATMVAPSMTGRRIGQRRRRPSASASVSDQGAIRERSGSDQGAAVGGTVAGGAVVVGAAVVAGATVVVGVGFVVVGAGFSVVGGAPATVVVVVVVDVVVVAFGSGRLNDGRLSALV